MNKAFRTRQPKNFSLPGRVYGVLKRRKGGVILSVVRVDLFECNDCEDNPTHCYCLAA